LDSIFAERNLKNTIMNTTIKVLVIAIMLLVTSVLRAQNFQGEATYKSKRQMQMELDSTQMDSDMQKRMMEMVKKQFEKTYILSFNKEESLFKEEEELEAPQPSGMQIVIAGMGGSDILYKNTKEERFANQNEMYGKVFLIEDKLVKQDWKLGSETKNIGNYTCYKATLIRERPVEIDGMPTPEQIENPEMEEYTTTAWYTPQIPVSNGPRSYHGLPGLILEVNDGSETIICSKIVMNPKDKVSISEPTKGKKVNQEEYNTIMEKKMKQMRERFQREDHDGDGMSIRIRG
jgi:GLPGLI family protein